MSERNRPTEEGRALGKEMARMADKEVADLGVDLRCKTCAFRAGTVPNGCPATLMDATKCAMEGEPFWCHERPHLHCAGWDLMKFDKPVKAPWPYSDGEDPKP